MDAISRTAGKQFNEILQDSDAVEAGGLRNAADRIKAARLLLQREGANFNGADVIAVAALIEKETVVEEVNRRELAEMSSGSPDRFDSMLKHVPDISFRMAMIHVADTAYMANLWFACRKDLAYTAADVLTMTEMVFQRERDEAAAKLAAEFREEARERARDAAEADWLARQEAADVDPDESYF